MHDAVLCNELRKRLEKGKTFERAKKELMKKGYPTYSIHLALREFYHDESTDYDDKLIRYIEKKLDDGNLLQTIYAKLVKKGHKPFEVQKAMLRATTTPNKNLSNAYRGWHVYSLLQVLVLIASIILAMSYKIVFIIPALAIIFTMVASSANIPKKNIKWKKELGNLPVNGMGLTQGVFGYNPMVGNYFKLWVLDPAMSIFAFFLLFGTVYGLLGYGVGFFIISTVLGGFSGLAFFIVQKRKSYRRRHMA